MKSLGSALFVAALFVASCVPVQASSAPFFLNFQYLKNLEPISNFYNGGLGGFGSNAGMNKNFGVTFSSNALGITSSLSGGGGNFAPTPLSTPAVFFTSGSSGYMNVAGGFSTGVNFFYAALAPATVTVWSGANGTGTVLASITLSVNGGSGAGCSGGTQYCNWTDVGLAFAGTAGSVTFQGPANYIGISDVTVGRTTTAIPEPTSLLLFGTGLVGFSTMKVRRALRREG